jgi:transcriptional regulator with XRE-family HTH domain
MRNPKNANPAKLMRKQLDQVPGPKSSRTKSAKPPETDSSSNSERLIDSGNESSLVALGERLRGIRNKLGMTLADAAKITGTGSSTLSKIETGQMSPTYDMLQKIVRGLEIDLVDLFDSRKHDLPRGRRDITRSGTGQRLKTPRYMHELLATELSHKRFFPFRSKITARSPILKAVDSSDNESSHAGEEFFYVLSGAVELHTDSYAPARLETGDSVYFDSGMRHAVISVSEEDAVVLWVASHG